MSTGGDVERLYRVGTVNFSALLHYNRSYFYASAVVDLSRAMSGGSLVQAATHAPAPQSFGVRLCGRLRINECRKLHAVVENPHHGGQPLKVAVHPLRVEDLRHDRDIGQRNHITECVAASCVLATMPRLDCASPCSTQCRYQAFFCSSLTPSVLTR